ncbi:RNA polymerase sigma-70 factor [Dictyobacter formicarum]|uniref:DNA-directed RNA polymerase sigma-70 factor n=1 Tax=Dictyobacter formicarum TaxID=2778368 RepID=A0ABQ3VSZ2_9CHLR|nr:RNA polymerase sigma-70 factor [Dictyobacter formicarum]GHO88688.1 DNA-directed RNA polymerase sigma-70 factor [Dictyobacter formicarum]
MYTGVRQLTVSNNSEQIFDQYRILLFSIAYRMLGSVSDAEDMVQESFVRWLQTDQQAVQSPKAYLSTVVVRLCIDHERLARAQREVYVGPWLPEPLQLEQYPDLSQGVQLDESLSYAFLIMLQKLGPLERAVFLLRDVFDYDYAEIAAIVEKSEVNCRQVLRRAHQHLEQDRARFEVSHEQQERLTSQFLSASLNGDMQGLLTLLAEDVVFTADSGGKVRAGLKPVAGADKVTRGMLGGMRFLPAGVWTRIEEINGQPAIVGYQDNRPYGIILLAVVGNKVQHVYTILNPDKLRAIRQWHS